MEIQDYRTNENFALRLEVRVKNAELIKARESLGLTLEKAAEMMGVSSNTLCRMENLKSYPSEEIQQKICDFYRNNGYFMLREDVFPYELSGIKARKLIAEKEIPKEKLVSLSNVPQKMLPSYYNLAEIIDEEEKYKELDAAVNELTERELNIIKLRFGLESRNPLTLEEVGKIIGVSKNRIRQIEEKAVRKLRSSPNSKTLRELVLD